jgi:hypothetical protein
MQSVAPPMHRHQADGRVTLSLARIGQKDSTLQTDQWSGAIRAQLIEEVKRSLIGKTWFFSASWL